TGLGCALRVTRSLRKEATGCHADTLAFAARRARRQGARATCRFSLPRGHVAGSNLRPVVGSGPQMYHGPSRTLLSQRFPSGAKLTALF
ncbi:MAG: hypothetical protein ACRD6W_18300, partial [Nitrososphaerales archaeon]